MVDFSRLSPVGEDSNIRAFSPQMAEGHGGPVVPFCLRANTRFARQSHSTVAAGEISRCGKCWSSGSLPPHGEDGDAHQHLLKG